jgi:hypothetical protein
MRLAILSLFMAAGGFLFHQTATAQTPTPRKADVRKEPSANFPFPCYAKKGNMPGTLNRFWSPKPANRPENQVDVTVGFHAPDYLAFYRTQDHMPF